MDFCKDHWEQPFTFYCSTCKQLVCNECIVSTHQTHTFCTNSKMRVEEESNRFYMKKIEYLWKQLKHTTTTVESLRKTETEIAEFYKVLHDLLIQEEHKIKKQVTSEIDNAVPLVLDLVKEIQTTKHVIESMGLEITNLMTVETVQESNNNNDDTTISEQVEEMVTEEIVSIRVVEDDINKLFDAVGHCSNLESFLKNESLFPKSVRESDKPIDQKQLIECMGYITQLKPSISIRLPIEYEVKFSEQARTSIVSSIPQLNDLYDKNRKFLVIHKSDGWIKLDLANETISNVDPPTSNSYYTLSVNGRTSLICDNSLYTFQDSKWKKESLIKSVPNITSSCHDSKNNTIYIFYSEYSQNYMLKWNLNDKSSSVSTLKSHVSGIPIFIDNSIYFFNNSTKQIQLLDQEKYTMDLHYSYEKVISRKLHYGIYDRNRSVYISTKKSIYKISVIDKTCTKITNLPCFLNKKSTIRMAYTLEYRNCFSERYNSLNKNSIRPANSQFFIDYVDIEVQKWKLINFPYMDMDKCQCGIF
ncbi:hypothetical protein PPL_03355 [Heterostelium album PN500]|uniref:B box-type domain-containing protein n=1 Tax=Heterostelium pallidum (strain ATCC 26659 / Pp 5 / PN500) TaxID=670386 RepID=D3B4N0_HETP5|nr:hypothetical protein PPL_03355 [Heterostelium album PN500]EFA84278.1 hypothetical protein PPL_03355 [Heterostelium album PN500]|eukprot:XP_020436394.1 hypothetical protein PPL_03355 [Heterostelium album PN500]